MARNRKHKVIATCSWADFVVLDANPLEDIENMRRINTVVKEGQVVDRDALPRNPILTSEEAINPGPVREK